MQNFQLLLKVYTPLTADLIDKMLIILGLLSLKFMNVM